MLVVDRARGTDAMPGPVTQLEGRVSGAGVSVIFVSTDRDGAGPFLHEHPYAETFVIHAGQARFTVGEEELLGVAGQVIVVPAYTPHRFAVVGPGRFESTNIHASDRFVTTWLDGPQADPLR
ncbi:cupin domain-containing protein [Georgenia sp. TF02-10]|uniref:cupin domain-containing protein n=1 Tax=Georgenia sp. TF02-10 TaxID=2917725 RepID=UPI001FA7188B|nr:cupin domain-containing protein [Georgenia sp. TF02-10]UNX53789.1 cupin domain-containing protein [Georgenia sp. TF02-10]